MTLLSFSVSINAKGRYRIFGFHIQARRTDNTLETEEQDTPMGIFATTSTTRLVCTDKEHGVSFNIISAVLFQATKLSYA